MIYTALGKYGVWPADGGTLSSHMIRSGDNTVVIDMGNGSLPKLLSACPLDKLDAVILLHLHHDHISDIFILDYAIGYLGAPRIQLYAPGEPNEIAEQLKDLKNIDCHTIDENSRLSLGELDITFLPVLHPVVTYAVKCADRNGKTAVYTADTVPYTELDHFAKGADLIIADACLLEEDINKLPVKHMTAKQAAELAKKAGCGSLILAHLLPIHTDSEYEQEARTIFEKSSAAQELKDITV